MSDSLNNKLVKSSDSQIMQMQDTVSNIPVDSSLDYNSLDEMTKQRVEQIKINTDLSSSYGVLSYGVEVQSKLAKFCDMILENVKAKEIDSDVAVILADLAIEIKNFDPEYEDKKGFITNFFGNLNKNTKKPSDSPDSIGSQIKHQILLSKKEAEKLQIKYENVSNTISQIEHKLENSKITLLRNVTIMDQMYCTNIDYYKELSVYIIAAKQKLQDYKLEVEKQRTVAMQTNNQMEIQKLNEMVDIEDKFDKKIDDLLRTRLISIQNAPQIRLVQRGSEQLIYQIQNSILTAIPVWKSQMVISLGIANNRTALGLQQHITDTTNELLRRNSELLKQGALEIATESEKGLVSVDTLRITNQNLIDTINGVIEIQKKGKEDRKVAEVEIAKLENELKKALKG